ncbi:hypothetical protein CHUAL_008610 [Chamberlinius hualienensis]
MKFQSAAIVIFAIFSSVVAAPVEDEVIYLPGLPYPPSFKHYSGYLEAIDDRRLHYWFVECESDPSTAPLVLWLNGGPGCSSVDGLLAGHGPFHVNNDSKTLYYNPYSWNKLANVIYLEAPAGVGYSYSNSTNYTTNDDETAANNYEALGSFFRKFPEYSGNEFYITGESYAGVYVPTLTKLVLEGPQLINLKSIAIGNGVVNQKMNVNAQVLYAAYHGLISQKTLNEFTTDCCQPGTPPTCDFFQLNNSTCAETLIKAVIFVLTSRIDPYSIYSSCDTPYGKYPGIFSVLESNFKLKYEQLILQLGDPELPCQNTAIETAWINQPDVRAALHIPEFLPEWTDCSSEVQFSYDQQYPDMTSFYEEILPQIPAILYYGDADIICNFVGGEWFVNSLNLEVLDDYRPWSYANQTAGFTMQYPNLTYLTVLGSGHMVPSDKPAQCLHILNNLINNLPF